MAGFSLRYLVISLFSVAVLAVGVIVLRTLTVSVRSRKPRPCRHGDRDFISSGTRPMILENLREALRFRTVSWKPHVYERAELTKFRKFIERAFPAVHSSPLVKYETIANYSLLYTLKGADETLKPYMLTSHLDVVPAEKERWDVDPFSGEMQDGYIYGRGSVDDKHGVMGILEALEFMLSSGFRPQRTVYIGFGHDEEVHGFDGAYAIGQLLNSQEVKLEFLLDEGLFITEKVVPGIDKPVALIGVAEKGQVMLKLSVDQKHGHSSMPPAETSIGILAAAVHRLETNPHKNMLGMGTEKGTLVHLASEMKLPFRILMSNLWLFSPLISWALSRTPSTNSMIRTVTAVTMFNAGIKNNVIPASATAVVNHRIHPAQSVQEESLTQQRIIKCQGVTDGNLSLANFYQVIDFDKEIVNDERVKFEIESSMESLAESSYGEEDFGFQIIKSTIQQVFDDVVVAPGLLVANTDTRHYVNLTENVYRFSPSYMHAKDLQMIHGDNERISIWNYERTVNFYYHLMKNSDIGKAFYKSVLKILAKVDSQGKQRAIVEFLSVGDSNSYMKTRQITEY